MAQGFLTAVALAKAVSPAGGGDEERYSRRDPAGRDVARRRLAAIRPAAGRLPRLRILQDPRPTDLRGQAPGPRALRLVPHVGHAVATGAARRGRNDMD